MCFPLLFLVVLRPLVQQQLFFSTTCTFFNISYSFIAFCLISRFLFSVTVRTRMILWLTRLFSDDFGFLCFTTACDHIICIFQYRVKNQEGLGVLTLSRNDSISTWRQHLLCTCDGDTSTATHKKIRQNKKQAHPPSETVEPGAEYVWQSSTNL